MAGHFSQRTSAFQQGTPLDAYLRQSMPHRAERCNSGRLQLLHDTKFVINLVPWRSYIDRASAGDEAVCNDAELARDQSCADGRRDHIQHAPASRSKWQQPSSSC